MIHELECVRTLKWSELQTIWKNKEAVVWKDYINELGLKDWEDYRFGPHGTFTRYGYDAFKLHEQEWKEYNISDLRLIAPRIYTGPFRSWTKYNTEFPNVSLTFFELILNAKVGKNKDIQWTMKSLIEGHPSFGIGLYEPEKGIISLFDGHHTFAALNLMIEKGFKGTWPSIPLYLAQVPVEAREFFYDLIKGRTEPIQLEPWAQ